MKKVLVSFVLMLACVASSAQSGSVEKMSTTIEFVVNTDIIIENDNYRYYAESILPEVAKRHGQIEAVLLVGSASPEGNAAGNIRLANLRAEKIYSSLTNYVPKFKVIKDNNYKLFLSKTGLDESDYTKLRATYVEIHFYIPDEAKTRVDTVYNNIVDTVYRDRIDTVYNNVIDTVFVERESQPKSGINTHCPNTDIVISIYNDLAGDLLKRGNVGAEVYFSRHSFFLDGYFTPGAIFGKTYNSDVWHTGFRRYFNDSYDKTFIELYGRFGYFDTDIFNENGIFGIFYGGGIGIGYKFNLCTHWKIYPSVRFGIDKIHYQHYYQRGGNVNVSFGKYVDGMGTESAEKTGTESMESSKITYNEKSISEQFLDNSISGLWLGPTFIGVTIQRDFHFKRNK